MGSQRVGHDWATEQQTLHMSYPGGPSGKESTSQCRRHRRHRFDPGAERSPGGGNGNPPQYARLENSRDRGASWAEYICQTSTIITLLLLYLKLFSFPVPVGRSPCKAFMLYLLPIPISALSILQSIPLACEIS